MAAIAPALAPVLGTARHRDPKIPAATRKGVRGGSVTAVSTNPAVPKSPDGLTSLVGRKSITSMSDEEIIQENLNEILDLKSRVSASSEYLNFRSYESLETPLLTGHVTDDRIMWTMAEISSRFRATPSFLAPAVITFGEMCQTLKPKFLWLPLVFFTYKIQWISKVKKYFKFPHKKCIN